MRRVLTLLLVLFAVAVSVHAQTTTVTPGTTYQTMDGWGAQDEQLAVSCCSYGWAMTNAQTDMFFSPTTGIGLEYVRTADFGCPLSGSCAVSTSNVSDLGTLQRVVAERRVRTPLVSPRKR